MVNKAYFQINGTRYMGYDIITDDSGLLQTKCICINREMRNELDNPDSTLYSQFIPNKGDEINLIPKCTIAIDDIRKNYKTKRGYDTGVCNVMSAPETTSYAYSRWCTYCIVPKKNTVFICTDWNHRNDNNYLLRMVYQQFSDVVANDCIFVCNNNSDVFWYRVHDAWHAFLDGILVKPAISYKKLTINDDNELTLDALRLVYKVCSKISAYCDPTKDEEAAVVVELNALNNYNWRDYPGTMDMIFNQLLKTNYGTLRYYRRQYSVYDKMTKHSSRYPKAVKIMMNHPASDFVSDKDVNMMQDFLRAELQLGDRKFVRLGDLKDKLDSIYMSLQNFDKVFSSVVKIEERKIDNEEKN